MPDPLGLSRVLGHRGGGTARTSLRERAHRRIAERGPRARSALLRCSEEFPVIVGGDGPAVFISARTAAWLERYGELTRHRVRVRGTDPEISQQLEEIRLVAMTWRGSATGTTEDSRPEPGASSQWLSTSQAADLLGVTPRAVVKAITRGSLPAVRVGGRHRLSREDVEHYRAARAA